MVCFEELWQEDLKLAVHADISDQDQSIYFPSVGTQVKDSETGAQIAHADEEVTLIDTVSYANVQPGEELTLQGVLMDKETGEELLIDGEPVTAETTFTPEESAGTVDVEFTFNASEVSGKHWLSSSHCYIKVKKSPSTRISTHLSRRWCFLLLILRPQIRIPAARSDLLRKKPLYRMLQNTRT